MDILDKHHKLIRYVNCALDDKDFSEEIDEAFIEYLINQKMLGLAAQLVSKYEMKNEKILNRILQCKKNIDEMILAANQISDFIINNKIKAFFAKGFVLSNQIYDDKYARLFGDIDIFCVKENIFQLCLYVESKGYENQLVNNDKQIIISENTAKRYHYENDNENVFEDPTTEICIEVKLGDQVLHGGFNEKDIHDFVDDDAIEMHTIDNMLFPSLNCEYSLLMLIANTYKNFNTHTGQILDFNIRDLIDVCYYLNKIDFKEHKIRFHGLLEKYNKIQEFYIVLKYLMLTFNNKFIYNFIKENNYESKVLQSPLYTQCNDISAFFTDSSFRIAQMEKEFRERIKRRISSQYPCDYSTQNYSFTNSQLYLYLNNRIPMKLSITNAEEIIRIQINSKLHDIQIPILLNLSFWNLNHYDPKQNYSFTVCMSKNNVYFADNSLGFNVEIASDNVVIQGIIPNECIYQKWIPFHAVCYWEKKNWLNYAGHLGRPYYPVLYVLK